MEDHTVAAPKPFTTNKRFVSSVIAVVLLAGGFYWYQIRPYEVRSTCALESGKRAFMEDSNKSDEKGLERLRIENESFETYYNLCVRSKGIAS